MKVSIHQSSYIPYLGYWNKIANSEKVIYGIHFQFSPNEMYQRTFMETDRYLTVPIIKDRVQIKDILINKKMYNGFMDRFRNYILTFKDAKNYHKYKDLLIDLNGYTRKFNYLYELNEYWFFNICKLLNLQLEIEYDVESKFTKSMRLAELLRPTDTYLSGSGGRNYLEPEVFGRTRILVQTLKKPLEYNGNILWWLFNYDVIEIYEKFNDYYTWESL